MPETGTSGSMSGDGKRGVGHRPQVTAPILDSTIASIRGEAAAWSLLDRSRHSANTYRAEFMRTYPTVPKAVTKNVPGS